MYIPANHSFEAFLSGCAVVREKPPQGFAALLSSSRIPADGRPVPDLYFTYPEAELQFESLLKKVSEALAKIGCRDDRQVAIATLALIVETRQPGAPAVEHANVCLSTTRSARLMQSLVVPGRPRSGYEVRFGDYAIKAFNPEKFLYWAERCNSAYPIDLRELRKIDYLYSGVRAGMHLPESEFRLVGVPPAGHTRRPPLRVQESTYESQFDDADG